LEIFFWMSDRGDPCWKKYFFFNFFFRNFIFRNPLLTFLSDFRFCYWSWNFPRFPRENRVHVAPTAHYRSTLKLWKKLILKTKSEIQISSNRLYLSTIRLNRTICPQELRLCKKKLLPEVNGLIHYIDPKNRLCLNYRQKTKENGFIIGSNFVGPSSNLKGQYRNSRGRTKTEEIYSAFKNVGLTTSIWSFLESHRIIFGQKIEIFKKRQF